MWILLAFIKCFTRIYITQMQDSHPIHQYYNNPPFSYVLQNYEKKSSKVMEKPCDAPKPGGPVDNSSTREIPVDFGKPDTTLLCPIYRDPYFHKNRAESPLFGELYLHDPSKVSTEVVMTTHDSSVHIPNIQLYHNSP